MPIFETADQLYTCFGGLLERMESHPNTQNVLKTLELTVKFTFSDPSGFMWLVVHRGEQSIYYGEYDETSDIELAMTGDVAHRFWMGEINVMEAITKRQIVPIGPLVEDDNPCPFDQNGNKDLPAAFSRILEKGFTIGQFISRYTTGEFSIVKPTFDLFVSILSAHQRWHVSEILVTLL